MKKLIGQLFALIVLGLLIVSSVLVIQRMETRPRTDDAFLLANTASIAPDVSGRIVSLNVRDNQQVKAGDILFVIEPDAYQLRLNAATAQRILTSATLARLEPLLGKGYVTAEKIDEARAARDSAQANEALAKRDLFNTTVRAPFNGKIVGLNIAAGEFASTGRPVFTLIDTNKWYVVANFRETDISKMKPGAAVTVYVMSNLDKPLTGHVDSVGWGVSSDEVSPGSGGLPRIAKSLNWVRLAQRFPVRILLEKPPGELMRVGASAVAVVHDETNQR